MRFYETLVRRGWWAILLAFAVAAVLLGRHAPDLQVEAGTAVLMNEGDPDLAYYDRTRPQWGYDEYVIVCVTGREWTSAEGAALLAELVTECERVPHASRVLSLLDVALLRQQPGTAFDLRRIPTLRDAGIDAARAREELLGHTQAVGNLVSSDGRTASVLVFLEILEGLRRRDALRAEVQQAGTASAEQAAELARLDAALPEAAEEQTRRRVELVAAVRGIAAAWSRRLGEPVRLSGIPVINVNLLEHLRHDLRVFGLAALGLFVLTFAVVYRRPRFVLLPILASALPVLLVVGTMSVLGMKVTIITTSLPLLLFVLMLPYTVYFVERYRERRQADPSETGVTSTLRAASAIFLPCLFSCLTTVAGFVALRTSDTRPVRDFGLMMAVGMAVGLVVVFLAIPAMSRPLPGVRVAAGASRTGLSRVVAWLSAASLRRPLVVVGVAAVALLASVAGATRLTAQSKFTSYFRASSEVYRGLEYIDTRMGGTTPLEIHLRSPEKGFFLTPAGLAAVAAVDAYFAGVPETGNVRSIANLVDEIRKKNPGVVPLLPALAKHPRVRSVAAEFVSPDHDATRVLVRMRETSPTLDRTRILDGLRAHLAARPELAGVESRVTGVFLLYANMLESLLETQRETLLWVVLAIGAMVLALFRSVALSLLVLSTQVLPTMVTLGYMGWAGIPLDLVTVMIAGIAMGIGIDASIQYAWRYRAELATGSEPREALRRTQGTVGRAIWIATTVVVCGFLVLLLSDFRPSIWFGLLNAVAMVVSQLAALTVLPALLVLYGARARPRGRGRTAGATAPAPPGLS